MSDAAQTDPAPVSFAIVGAGLVGAKHLRAIVRRHRVTVVADTRVERAERLALTAPGCVATSDWRAAVRRDDVQAVVVATTNDWLSRVSQTAIEAGKHILVEKPAARSAQELAPLIASARSRRLCARVGFNLRFHPAFLKAHELVSDGHLGPLLFVRGRYGHGGRVGYEREWRAKREISGGGELIDQGVHLIDLSRWFLGDFVHVEGHLTTRFWNMEVEDNAFLMLRTAVDQVAWLHASCTEWKNLFCFEIYGRDGKLQIDGLGGSYGTERLTFYRMTEEMGPPETAIWEYPRGDDSWEREIDALVADIRRNRGCTEGLEECAEVLAIVDSIYEHAGVGT